MSASEDELHPRRWMTTDEWVRYTSRQTISAQCAVLGLLMFAVGQRWALQATDDFIVATPSGVLIVEGGMRPGFVYGACTSALGVALLAFSLWFWMEVWQISQGDARDGGAA